MSDTSNVTPQPLRGASIDLQERTLKVTNIDSNVSKELLHELFSQAGPVVNVVHKPEFAFIEFEDADSVGYAMALMKGVALHGAELQMQPKLQNRPEYFRYLNTLKQYESTIACNPNEWWQRFGSPDRPIPHDLCRGIVCQMPPAPIQQQVPHFRHQFSHHNYMPNVPLVPHHLYQYNMPPPKDSYKHSRYSLPNDNFNRNYNNGNSVNGRYGDRYSPYRRPMDRNNSQFYERDYRDTDWRHRRSN